MSLGPLLFNYSSHLADGDSVRFHQHLASFSCPCIASLQTAASDPKITCWFLINTAERNRVKNLNLNTWRQWISDYSNITESEWTRCSYYECVINKAESVCLLVHVVSMVLLTSKVFPGGFPGTQRSRPVYRTPGPGSPAKTRTSKHMKQKYRNRERWQSREKQSGGCVWHFFIQHVRL